MQVPPSGWGSQVWSGAGYSRLFDLGRMWFDDYRRDRAVFVAETLRAVAEHRALGDTLVLMSESFRPCVAPLAACLTGEIAVPMIGNAKAEAIGRVIDALGVDAGSCAAYAGRFGDLPMLHAVGRPYVVGDHPVLVAHARRLGWPVLAPASRTPARS